MITIRIHHFLDIIRDFGTDNEIMANLEYKHSYHSIAKNILNNPSLQMKIVLGNDSVCEGCIYDFNSKCNDSLTKYEGFTMKGDYNDHLDKKILESCNITIGQIITPKEICDISNKYIENIDYIYSLASKENREIRKNEFIKGLEKYRTL